MTGPLMSADDLFRLEEEVDLDLGVLGAVRTMDRIGFDRLCEGLADRALVGIGRVGGTHHFAVLRDGIVALEHLDDDRARDHEADQIVEEGALAVDAVEALGLRLRHVDALGGDDAQAGLFELRGDRAGQVATRGVGLDDRESPFGRHRGRLHSLGVVGSCAGL